MGQGKRAAGGIAAHIEGLIRGRQRSSVVSCDVHGGAPVLQGHAQLTSWYRAVSRQAQHDDMQAASVQSTR